MDSIKDILVSLQQENKRLQKENKKLKKRLDIEHAWEYDTETDTFTKVPFPEGMPDRVDIERLTKHMCNQERKAAIKVLLKIEKLVTNYFKEANIN